MEPPSGFLSSLWKFILFLPFFIGLLILGTIKGTIICPVVALIIAIGNAGIILGLWPMHVFHTYYCVLSTKKLGPGSKVMLSIGLLFLLLLWPLVGIGSSAIGGAVFGYISALFATFQAVGGKMTNSCYHITFDGTWDTVKKSFTIVRDVKDFLYYSYFSIMDDLRLQDPTDGKHKELRVLYIPVAILVASMGILADFAVISMTAAYKVPYMLYKGWRRLSQDCIGREGPFLETICVPFAGLALLLWPFAVVTAFSVSVIASVFLGAYAGVIVYQECSFRMGLNYIAASWAMYDEYSNDFLGTREGSCYPRPAYRQKRESDTSSESSLSRPESFKKPPSDTDSISAPLVELVKPFELADHLFKDCVQYGELMVSEGVLTVKDFEDALSNKDSSQVISIGLPAYAILQAVIRGAKAKSAGILLSDGVTEVTLTNRPRDAFVDWFLNPVLVIKQQIQAQNLSDSEEDYLGKLVLLSGDLERLRNSNIGLPPESKLRQAEFEALARRLRGMMKSISRFPTFKRRFETIIKTILEELGKKNGGSKTYTKSKSMFARMLSDKSSKTKTGYDGYDPEAQLVNAGRDIEIQ